MASYGVVPNTCLPRKSHAPTADNSAQQMAPLVSPDTPSHCTFHSRTLTVQPHSVRLIDKQDGTILPSSDTRPSPPMSNRTRQLLSEAQRLAQHESQRTGRRVTAMDVILESTRLVAPAQPYRCAAKTRVPHAQKRQSYASESCLGEMELYQLEQVAIAVLTTAYGRKVSAERSTSQWPPNLDD